MIDPDEVMGTSVAKTPSNGACRGPTDPVSFAAGLFPLRVVSYRQKGDQTAFDALAELGSQSSSIRAHRRPYFSDDNLVFLGSPVSHGRLSGIDHRTRVGQPKRLPRHSGYRARPVLDHVHVVVLRCARMSEPNSLPSPSECDRRSR